MHSSAKSDHSLCSSKAKLFHIEFSDLHVSKEDSVKPRCDQLESQLFVAEYLADENSVFVPADVAAIVHPSQKETVRVRELRQLAWQSNGARVVETRWNLVVQALMPGAPFIAPFAMSGYRAQPDRPRPFPTPTSDLSNGARAASCAKPNFVISTEAALSPASPKFRHLDRSRAAFARRSGETPVFALAFALAPEIGPGFSPDKLQPATTPGFSPRDYQKPRR
jgi:hypothetical protein